MNILEEADLLTSKDRNQQYGDASEQAIRVTKAFNAITGHTLDPKDWHIFHIIEKLDRENYKHKRDNLVDLAGYAKLLSDHQES